MKLTQLIYVSQIAPGFSEASLVELVDRSAINNARLNISGVLLCCGKHLMQLLEGDITHIAPLYAKIREDHRHTDAKVLLHKRVKKRLFPEWGMGLADLNSRANLNRDRLASLIEQVRTTQDTAHYSVEARMLLQDFRQQLLHAA